MTRSGRASWRDKPSFRANGVSDVRWSGADIASDRRRRFCERFDLLPEQERTDIPPQKRIGSPLSEELAILSHFGHGANFVLAKDLRGAPGGSPPVPVYMNTFGDGIASRDPTESAA
jgi:hypothetical protein